MFGSPRQEDSGVQEVKARLGNIARLPLKKKKDGGWLGDGSVHKVRASMRP